MMEVSPIVYSLLVEFSIVSAVILIGWTALRVQHQAALKKNMRSLSEKIRGGGTSRKDFLQKKLSANLKLDLETINKSVNNIHKKEKLFYQKFIHIILKQDHKEAMLINQSLEALIDEFLNLKAKASDSEDDEDGNIAPTPSSSNNETDIDQTKRIAELEEENEQLKEEVKITRDTMANMMQEFASMYGGGAENDMEDKAVAKKLQSVDQNQV
ncbi:MAG: hypothetical protein JKY93_07770 [Gammaproteobacteria bacterium]|nr:hypothetical protein [Gammaproteobacteria bacterium]